MNLQISLDLEISERISEIFSMCGVSVYFVEIVKLFWTVWDYQHITAPTINMLCDEFL